MSTRPCCACAARSAPPSPAPVLLTGCEFNGAYDLPLPGSPVDEDDSYEVTAEFADILNVVPRSPVMVDDVTVGEVTEVDRDGWHAKITMRVRDDVELPDNVIADIRQVSLLGEKYVALEAPTGVAPRGRARRRRQHPDRVDRPQPGGRRGARRPLLPAQRRRRRPARHHHPGAQQRDERPDQPAAQPARHPRERGRHPRRPEGRHHPRPGVDEQPDRHAQRGARHHHRRARRRRPGHRRAGRPARRAGRHARRRSTGSAWSAPA